MEWSKSTECVWEGPKFLKTKRVLSSIYGDNPNASEFFKTILKVPDAGYKDVLQDLEVLSTTIFSSPEEDVAALYSCLVEMARSDDIIDSFRYVLSLKVVLSSSRTTDREQEQV